jgi:hypothetical protein
LLLKSNPAGSIFAYFDQRFTGGYVIMFVSLVGILAVVAMVVMAGYLLCRLVSGMRSAPIKRPMLLRESPISEEEVADPIGPASVADHCAEAEKQLNPEGFASAHEYAAATLRFALAYGGFSAWDIGEGEDKKLGWCLGVNLGWPELDGAALKAQCLRIREFCEIIGRSNRLEPITSQPGVVADGAMCVFVGFITEAFTAKTGKAKQPIYDPQIPAWETHEVHMPESLTKRLKSDPPESLLGECGPFER